MLCGNYYVSFFKLCFVLSLVKRSDVKFTSKCINQILVFSMINGKLDNGDEKTAIKNFIFNIQG